MGEKMGIRTFVQKYRSALLCLLVVPLYSSCFKDLKPEASGISCDSKEFQELQEQKYLEMRWGGSPPSKELQASVLNKSASSAVDLKDLEALNSTDEYEITLTGQSDSVRYSTGQMPSCYETLPCLKSDGTLKKAGYLCADSNGTPFILYVRSIENYTCENFSASTSLDDWANSSSAACKEKPTQKSASGVFRFRLKTSSYAPLQGQTNLWFTDDHDRGFQATVGL
jgi:hypothetical protein